MAEQKTDKKEAELAKIEIYAEQCNTSIGIFASAAITAILGFSVLFWTLIYTKAIPLSASYPSLIGINIIGFISS